MATTPMFAPDGSVRLVPSHQVNSAVDSGGEIAHQMQAPDGTMRYVRDSQFGAALKAGGVPAAAVTNPIPPKGQMPFTKADEDKAMQTAMVSDALQNQYSGMASGAKEGAKIAPYLITGDLASAATKGAPLALRALVQAGAMGGTSALMGGSKSEINTSTLLGAAGELSAAGINKVTNPIIDSLKAKALKQYTQALAPTTNPMKNTAQKIVPEMIDRGITGGRQSIEDLATSQASSLKPQLDAAYANMPSSQLPTQEIKTSLENLRQRYLSNGVPVNPSAVKAIEGVQDVVNQLGDQVSPDSLRKTKAIFDESVAASKGYMGGDLTTKFSAKAQKTAADSIRQILHQDSPDVAALDKEVNFWLNVQKVLKATNQRTQGQSTGLGTQVMSAASGATGLVGTAVLASSHNAEGAVASGLAGIGGSLLIKVMRSPAWNTTSAVMKNNIADALASGQISKASLLASQILSARSTARPQGR